MRKSANMFHDALVPFAERRIINITVRNFLKMHKDGIACVSIHQEPYVHKKHGYVKTYFEEEYQEDIIESETFKNIASKQVDHFNIIGGVMYKVELCIYLK